MITIKEYANVNNISYEAVRKQVSRYSKELSGHVLKNGRTQFLDDYAADFLDNKRKNNPVVVYEVSKDEEREKLKKANEELWKKLNAVQDELIKAQRQLIENAPAKELAAAQSDLAVVQNNLVVLQREADTLRTEKLEAEAKAAAELKAKEEENVALQQMAAHQNEQNKLQREASEKRISELQAELEAEKAKSWWQKLWGR